MHRLVCGWEGRQASSLIVVPGSGSYPVRSASVQLELLNVHVRAGGHV